MIPSDLCSTVEVSEHDVIGLRVLEFDALVELLPVVMTDVVVWTVDVGEDESASLEDYFHSGIPKLVEFIALLL